MTPEAKRKLVHLLSTEAGRKLVASHMQLPIRCGGSGYNALGERYLIRGGVPYYGPTEHGHDPRTTDELNQVFKKL